MSRSYFIEIFNAKVFQPLNYIILAFPRNRIHGDSFRFWSQFVIKSDIIKISSVYVQSKKHQKVRIPEIRFLVKIEEPVLLMWRPYSLICDSFIFSWEIKSKLDSLTSSIKALLISFAFALSTRSTGVEMVILVDGKYFKMKFLRFCISWNISYGLKRGALLVPTWMIMLSDFSLRSGTTKNILNCGTRERSNLDQPFLRHFWLLKTR